MAHDSRPRHPSKSTSSHMVIQTLKAKRFVFSKQFFVFCSYVFSWHLHLHQREKIHKCWTRSVHTNISNALVIVGLVLLLKFSSCWCFHTHLSTNEEAATHAFIQHKTNITTMIPFFTASFTRIRFGSVNTVSGVNDVKIHQFCLLSIFMV